MTTRHGMGTAAAALALLAAPGTTALAQSLDIRVALPDTMTWTLAEEKIVGNAYSREWVPQGQTIESAEWLIAQQKVPLEERQSAMDFLEMIYELSAQACTEAEHDDPERLRVDGVRGVVGRTMCAHRLGEEYGVFSDQTVFVEGGYAYVVTSELRIPPMIVAGVLAFDRGDPEASRAAADAFMDREELSRALVREGIRVAEN